MGTDASSNSSLVDPTQRAAASPPAETSASHWWWPFGGGEKPIVVGPCILDAKNHRPNAACSCQAREPDETGVLIENFLSIYELQGTSRVNPTIKKYLTRLGESGVGKNLVSLLARSAPGSRIKILHASVLIGHKLPFQPAWSITFPDKSRGQAANFDEKSHAITPGVNNPHRSLSDCTIVWDEEYVDEMNPGWVLIGHELIHALHYTMAEGLAAWSGRDACDKLNQQEEARTIGTRLDGWHGEYISENEMRAEAGLPLRASHCALPGMPATTFRPAGTDDAPWPISP